jgi:hypothetical protein
MLMYESQKEASNPWESRDSANKVMKVANLVVLVVVVGMIVKMVFFPGFEGETGLRVFMAIVWLTFMAPFFLCLKAFSSPPKMRKSAIFFSVIWCLCVAVGVFIQELTALAYAIYVVFVAVSFGNIFFLLKMGRAKSA